MVRIIQLITNIRIVRNVLRQVHELKKLSHEMFELRDVHLKEIRQLREEALTRTSSNATTLSQMFPADEVAEAREEAATLRVRCRVGQGGVG